MVQILGLLGQNSQAEKEWNTCGPLSSHFTAQAGHTNIIANNPVPEGPYPIMGYVFTGTDTGLGSGREWGNIDNPR